MAKASLDGIERTRQRECRDVVGSGWEQTGRRLMRSGGKERKGTHALPEMPSFRGGRTPHSSPWRRRRARIVGWDCVPGCVNSNSTRWDLRSHVADDDRHRYYPYPPVTGHTWICTHSLEWLPMPHQTCSRCFQGLRFRSMVGAESSARPLCQHIPHHPREQTKLVRASASTDCLPLNQSDLYRQEGCSQKRVRIIY